MKIYDIPGFNMDDLDYAFTQGWVVRRKHPVYNLFILNYTDRATYGNADWNETLSHCRGLIHDNSFNIVARGFRKFWNVGDKRCAPIQGRLGISVTDKMDGSLGIAYTDPDGDFAIATRGSFESPQAVVGTRLLYNYEFAPAPGITYLFEIICPESRVVVKYGESKLVLLATIDNQTGYVDSADVAAHFGEWYGPTVQTFEFDSLADAVSSPPRSNAEGFVIRDRETSAMQKWKYEDYITAHRLVSNLSEKAVWEWLREHDGDYSGLVEQLDDDYARWVTEKADNLVKTHESMIKDIRWHFDYHYQDLKKYGLENNRKCFADVFKEYEVYRPFLFLLLDGKDITDAVWKWLKPKSETKAVERDEDVA